MSLFVLHAADLVGGVRPQRPEHVGTARPCARERRTCSEQPLTRALAACALPIGQARSAQVGV
ncbi:hypothetical protein [Microbacterium sp. NPDC055357]